MTSLNGHAPTIRMSLHDSIHMIHREDWTHVTKKASMYLQYDHLVALEDVMTGSMEFRYAIYYCSQNQPIGVAYFQVVELVDNGSNYRQAVGRLGSGIGRRIIKDMKVRSLVSGNVFHCGDHGSYFTKEVSDEHRLWAVEDTLKKLDKGGWCSSTASILVFKDLLKDQFDAADTLTKKNYHPLAMDVNMVMEVDPTWRTLDDYLEVLNSKARTRIKAIQERSKELVIRDLSAAGISKALPRLQSLFDQVLDRSPFLFGRLRMDVYPSWKEHHGDRLLFRGFFLNEEPVGFSTAFVLRDQLDVQYVGFDQTLNQTHAIYLRMLVDMLELALSKGLRRITFGRTAEQAKSNLGALPEETRFYVKHRNRLANKLVGPFLRSVEPDAFEQRSPFKTDHR